MKPSRIVIDTDPGIDDALAIFLALASPEIELSGLTVTGGNCSVEQGVRNALDLVALAGRADLPVTAGVSLPLIRPPLTAPETHGPRGLGYAQLANSGKAAHAEHGVDFLIREILAHPGEVTVVAIAPLTNLALAIRKEPRIVSQVREVIIMGGALQCDGNTTPLAEFNFCVDPHAAYIVLHSGMPITLLPWDITRTILFTQKNVDALLQSGTGIARFVADATRFYIEFHREYFGTDACAVNDPAAVVLVFRPELARLKPVFVDIEISSPLCMAKSVADFIGFQNKAPNAKVVVEFDREGFISLLLERLARLPLSN